jgi:hypothetical protein
MVAVRAKEITQKVSKEQVAEVVVKKVIVTKRVNNV